MDKKYKVVFKITWPNGKIYIGSDLCDGIAYFGSPSRTGQVAIRRDFPDREAFQKFSITKEILWESEDADDKLVRKKEVEFIRTLRSNDPKLGYNLTPRFKG